MSTAETTKPMGAGDHLHDLLVRWFGEDVTTTCGCRAWIEKMNQDLQWAKDHVPQIASKLRKEAKKRNWWKFVAALPGTQYPLRALVHEAIRRTES